MRIGRKAESGPKGRRSLRSVSPAAFARAASIVLLAGAACVLALKVSVEGVLADVQPAFALTFAPDDAFAKANLATRLIAAGRVDEGRQLSIASLARNPINVEAVRNLALAAEAQHDQSAAARLFDLANLMSRRDRPTQIWRIRRAIENGNFEAAMHGFDVAMRTSEDAREYLGSMVVAATADRGIVPPLARALDRNPAWRADLLRTLVYSGPNPEHVALLIRGHLDPSVPGERMTLQAFLDRLVRQGQFDLAWAVYRNIAGAATNPGLRDGGFEQPGDFVPFDWVLTDENDLVGIRGTRPDGRPGHALTLVAHGRGGQVARQLIRLAAGQYRIMFEVGAVPEAPAERPRVTMTCAGNSQELGEWKPGNAGAAPQRVVGEVRIPPQCAWLWLSVSLNMDEAPTDDPWLDNLSVQPLAAAG